VVDPEAAEDLEDPAFLVDPDDVTLDAPPDDSSQTEETDTQ
jgi:hypothetical protein